MSHDPNCVFCKIIRGQIPSRKVYEDDDLLAFHDIAPWAPVHFLIVPKFHVPSLLELKPEHDAWLGKMLALAEGALNGFRCVINNGHDGGQEVPHLHLHVMGGARPWSKG
jgi:histidine triad (HIT) family protein